MLDYSALSDDEIIELIGKKDDDAMDYLVNKYGVIVKREIRTMYLIGAEMEDLSQEGMIGLFKAIRDYESEKGTSFSTFATLCIRRQIQTAISSFNRKKHSPLNTYISIYSENDEYGNSLDMLEAEKNTSDPEEMIIAKEQKKAMENRIKRELSPLENNVLHLYLEGMSYADIAARLGKTEKTVNNALQRIRNKLSKK